MRKTVLSFGFAAGAVSVFFMLVTAQYVNTMNFRKGDILGYTSIALSALLVFFGIRSFREKAERGLTFGRALLVGVAISLVSSLCYVAAFQVFYFKLMPGIGERYAACMVERVRLQGGGPDELAKAARMGHMMKQLYDQPLTNVAMSFAESFPAGLLVSAISALILRKKGHRNEDQIDQRNGA